MARNAAIAPAATSAPSTSPSSPPTAAAGRTSSRASRCPAAGRRVECGRARRRRWGTGRRRRAARSPRPSWPRAARRRCWCRSGPARAAGPWCRGTWPASASRSPTAGGAAEPARRRPRLPRRTRLLHGSGRRRRPAPAPRAPGTAIAISLNQYWKACTSVIDRMPPATTLSVTTTRDDGDRRPSGGSPVTCCSTRPAPCSCGTRYSQAMTRPARWHSAAHRREPQPDLREVRHRVRTGAAQRRGHEQLQREVAGGEPDRVPQHRGR